MPLLINAPHVEDRLKKAAAKKGVKPVELAVQILSNHLGSEGMAEQREDLPFYATTTPERWIAEFDNWVESHPRREPLPTHAFDRASFYEGRP